MSLLWRIPFVNFARPARSDFTPADSRHQSFQRQFALEHLQLSCEGQPTEAALGFNIVHVIRVRLARRVLGTLVAPGDLFLDCAGRTAFCNSERFARRELGGVFPDMLRMSLGTVFCCEAGLACSAREQDDYEASSTSWPTWTDAPCCCSRVPNLVSWSSGFTLNIVAVPEARTVWTLKMLLIESFSTDF